MPALVDILDQLTAPGELFSVEEEPGALRCSACAHRCLLRQGRRGICQVRFNRGGELRVPWGYVAGAHADPIEKKPFAHVLPGSIAFTFGMLGCNFHCDFCQNWLSSQVLRDPQADDAGAYIQRASPELLVAHARRSGARVMASSYNEPLITSEWAAAVFRLARQAGMRCVFVSNGYATPQVLDYLRPHLDAYKVDLKTMRASAYRQVGGVLAHVLDTIAGAHLLGLWVEVVTLVIPGFNDSNEELWDAARFITSVSPDIPWHVTAFHPDYHMQDRPPTPSSTLQRAAEIGQEAGLHYVYAGNLPGRVGSLEDTFCPHCQAHLVRRRGFLVVQNLITPQGTCPKCAHAIAGVWQ